MPAYSYDNRVAEILRWHEETRQEGSEMAAAVTGRNYAWSQSIDINSALH